MRPSSARIIGGFERRDLRPDRVRPRKTAFDFSKDIPRHWVNGNVARSHFMNALHLFLPPFERMIARVIRDEVIPLLQDPALREQGRGFMGQESVHGRAHELFHENLRDQGYRIDRYLAFADWVFGDLFAKRLGTKVSLSMVAAFEHYTDLLVPLVLDGDFLEGCDPQMKELFEWHAAEEVEHSGVAFEMLQAIDDGQGLRLAGNVLGLAVLFGFLVGGTLFLLEQDGKLEDREAWRELRGLLIGKYRLAQDAARLFARYTRPDYSPGGADYSHLAREVLAAPRVTA